MKIDIENRLGKELIAIAGSVFTYEMVHGVATYLTKYLEAGEVIGSLAALAVLGAGYKWAAKNKTGEDEE